MAYAWWKKTPHNPVPPAAIYVELPPLPQTALTKSGNKKGSRGGGHSKSSTSVWKLAPSGFSMDGPRNYGENSAAAGSGGKNLGYALAESMGLKEESRFYPQANQVLKRLEEEIFYPAALAEERVQGMATLQFTLHEDGTLDKILEITCENSILRIFALASLIGAFKRPLARKLSGADIPFVARLHFQLIHTEIDRPKREIPQFKNILNIERKFFIQSKTMEEMQYWSDRIPVKPTPIGPIVDFVALYQLLKDTQVTDPRWLRFQRVLQDLELWQREVEQFQKKQRERIL